MERVSRVEVLRASPALFSSRWLDRLTRVRPVVPPLVFGPAAVGLVVVGALRLSGLVVVGLVAAGYGVWTLTEYWVHRVVFHLEPRSRVGRRVHFVIHGVHHDHPNDPLRLVMPPVVSVPAAAVFFALFAAAVGLPAAFPLTGGFYGGYLAYDMLHFALHHRRPRSRLGRLLHRHHMRHHFQDDSRGYGVSAPWWDHVFRTAPTRHRTERHPTPKRDPPNGDGRQRGSSGTPSGRARVAALVPAAGGAQRLGRQTELGCRRERAGRAATAEPAVQDHLLGRPVEVVRVGPADVPAARALARVLEVAAEHDPHLATNEALDRARVAVDHLVTVVGSTCRDLKRSRTDGLTVAHGSAQWVGANAASGADGVRDRQQPS